MQHLLLYFITLFYFTLTSLWHNSILFYTYAFRQVMYAVIRQQIENRYTTYWIFSMCKMQSPACQFHVENINLLNHDCIIILPQMHTGKCLTRKKPTTEEIILRNNIVVLFANVGFFSHYFFIYFLSLTCNICSFKIWHQLIHFVCIRLTGNIN